MLYIQQSSYKKMPWKNGGGQTAEIERVPGGEGPFHWRLSQADIAVDGPFSKFSGYERLLCVFRGEAILLNDFRLEAMIPFRFSGDQPIECRLTNGPVSDLGLIFDRDKFFAEMSITEGKIKIFESSTNYFFDLQKGNTLKTDAPGELTVPKSIWVSIRPQI